MERTAGPGHSPMNRSELLREPLQSDHWATWAEELLHEGRQDAAIRAYRIAKQPFQRSPLCPQPGLAAERRHPSWIQLHEHRPWMPWFAWLKQKLGPANLSSDQVLLISEQGLGDTLHFLRYANGCQLQGKRVLLLCQPQLVELIQQLTPISNVEAFWDPTTAETPDQQMQRRWPGLATKLGLNATWSWAPLMSLAHLLGHEAHLPLQPGHGLQRSFFGNGGVLARSAEAPAWPSLDRSHLARQCGGGTSAGVTADRSLSPPGWI